MKIIDCKELEELAEYFPGDSPLYAVGGCVRDAIRGEKCYDVDLSGAVEPHELVELLAGSPFKVTSASPRLGTVIIKGKDSYEYTTFRIDSYPSDSGVHTPSNVEFTRDLYTDAKRRDFKCNAVYYEIKSEKIIDPLGGVDDIQKGILSATIDPDVVLSQDGLRILRLVRFVSALGYEVESKTYESAKKLVSRLREITVERVRGELNRILAGKYCYKALTMMKELGILKIILPELAFNDGIAQKPQYHKYDVLEHIFKTVEYSPVNVRLAALFHDIGKGKCQVQDGNTYMHNLVGADLTSIIMRRLKYPTKQIERTVRIVKSHMYDVNGDAKEFKCRKFIAKNLDILDDLLALMQADCLATGYLQSSRTAKKLRDVYERMVEKQLPFGIKQLDICGEDLKAIGFGGVEIGNMLEELWLLTLAESIRNEKRHLIDYAKAKFKKNRRDEDK